MSGFAIPRVRVRARRRKPRGPEWWWRFAWLAAACFMLVTLVLAGALVTAAGMALLAIVDVRLLRRWPCDPEGPRGTWADTRTDVALACAALALFVVGVFVP